MNPFRTFQGIPEYPNLEIEYEKSSGLLCKIQAAEEARRLRVRTLFLEEDNSDLNELVSEKEERIEVLEESLEKTQNSLETRHEEVESLRGELQIKAREIHHLKTEIESLRLVSTESTKILTEKLALSREISVLKPELEHLRAQHRSNQGLFAEKLSLQRDLNAVRVELDTERRALHRAISKDEGRSAKDAQLESEIEGLRAELLKERKERLSIERQAQKAAADSDNQTALLESKIENFRSKLKNGKDQLKETQLQLENHRKELDNLGKERNMDVHRNTRKRSIMQFEGDDAMGTPDGLPAVKRQKRGSTLPGDKSNFSITPFLNRTMSLAPDTPENLQPGNADKSIQPQANLHQKSSNMRLERESTSTKETIKKQNPGTKARETSGARKGSRQVQSKLDKVREEDEEPNPDLATVEAECSAQPKKSMSMDDETAKSSKAMLPKKKRRALGNALGKTLFDDDEGGSAVNDSRGGIDELKFTMTKRVGLGPKTTLQGGKGSVRSLASFGDFSPLKKDRKPTL